MSNSNNKEPVSDFLSQEEVNNILRGVMESPSFIMDDEPVSNEPKSYDLGRQERIVRGRMPGLELIDERFARLFRTTFFKRFGRSTEISVGPIRLGKYSSFIRNLVVPTNLNVIDFGSTLCGSGLIIFEPSLVYLCVDSAFGSDGRFHCRVEGREFTLIEQTVIHQMFDAFREAYLESFSWCYPLDIRYVRSEMNTQFANIATPSELVVSTTFTVEMSGNCAEMHICIPYNTLEPIVKMLQSTFMPDIVMSNGSNKRIPIGCLENDVVVVAEGKSCVNDVKGWKIGDVLQFDTFGAYIMDKKVFSGQYDAGTFKITCVGEEK